MGAAGSLAASGVRASQLKTHLVPLPSAPQGCSCSSAVAAEHRRPPRAPDLREARPAEVGGGWRAGGRRMADGGVSARWEDQGGGEWPATVGTSGCAGCLVVPRAASAWRRRGRRARAAAAAGWARGVGGGWEVWRPCVERWMADVCGVGVRAQIEWTLDGPFVFTKRWLGL